MELSFSSGCFEGGCYDKLSSFPNGDGFMLVTEHHYSSYWSKGEVRGYGHRKSGEVISVVDIGIGQVTKSIKVGTQDRNVALSPDQKFAWVSNNNDGTISIISPALKAW